MVDGVNFNPFTNQVLTPEQIEKLDKDGNGKVSYDELVDGLSWLSGGTDEEGAVDFSQFGDDLINNVRKAGMGEDKNTISSEAELKAAMDTVADEYQEMYFTNNTDVDDATRNMIKNLITKTKTDFIKTIMQGNKKGPWDLRLITDLFANEMDKVIAEKKEALSESKTTLDGYVAKAQTGGVNSLEQLVTLITNANENKNISNAEWKEIKEMAAQFLIGQLLSEDGANEDTDAFLKGINSNYKSNSYYKTALDAINKIKSSSDPDEIQKLLDTAIKAVQNFLEVFGRDKVATAANNTMQAKIEKQGDQDLSQKADAWLESKITASMTDEEKQYLKDFVKSAKERFIAENYKDGVNKSTAELQSKFVTFLDTEYENLKSVQGNLTTTRGNSETAFDKLVATSDKANANKNITDEEKADIIKAASDFVLSQMLNNPDSVSFLAALNPNYAKSTEFIELKGIVNKMKTCTDPKELETLIEQAKVAIQKMLEKYSGEQLVKAVDSLKPITADNAKNTAIYNSELYGDYSVGSTRSSGYSRDKGNERNEIEQMARDDMRKYADSLKEQLKIQYGTAYNEAEIEQYIQNAMNDTIVEFWNNGDNGGFKYETRKGGALQLGHRRHQYTYNVQGLIDTFTKKFNEAAKVGSAQKVDPNNAPPYDKENVLAESGLTSDYTETHETDWDPSNDDKAKILTEAKLKLSQLSTQIKASLIASGVKIDSAVIDKILNEATMETIKGYNFETDINAGTAGTYVKYGYNSKALFDTFFAKVDEKLEAAKKKQ